VMGAEFDDVKNIWWCVKANWAIEDTYDSRVFSVDCQFEETIRVHIGSDMWQVGGLIRAFNKAMED
jgi:hypothetical protein